MQYIRKVGNNNTVRIGRRVIDIPRTPRGRSSYAKTLVTVRHLLDGRYRVYFGGQAIAEAKAAPPTAPRHEPLTLTAKAVRYEKARMKARAKKHQGVTESLTC